MQSNHTTNGGAGKKRKQGSYQDQLQQSQKLAFPDRGERICHYPIPSIGANLVTDSYQRIGVAAGIMDDAIITGVVRHRDGYSTVDLVLFFLQLICPPPSSENCGIEDIVEETRSRLRRPGDPIP